MILFNRIARAGWVMQSGCPMTAFLNRPDLHICLRISVLLECPVGGKRLRGALVNGQKMSVLAIAYGPT